MAKPIQYCKVKKKVQQKLKPGESIDYMEFTIKSSYIVLFVHYVLHIHLSVKFITNICVYVYNVYTWISKEPVVKYLLAHPWTAQV